MAEVIDAPLGKITQYPDCYDASLLFPIERQPARGELGLSGALPFSGYDSWSAYEVSWLNKNGKPVVVIGDFNFNCTNPYLVESKSFKLYLNAFNLSQFESIDAVEAIMARDLSHASGGEVEVKLLPLGAQAHQIACWSIPSLDSLDLTTASYSPDVNLLQVGKNKVSQCWQTHLFRSLCPVTSQPDWASIRIEYTGLDIEKHSLLAYLVAYRTHQGFHEQCVEHIFSDINKVSQADSLLVEARFTRRGGLDINPIRMKGVFDVGNHRLSRQ